jgi:hypothetical protein
MGGILGHNALALICQANPPSFSCPGLLSGVVVDSGDGVTHIVRLNGEEMFYPWLLHVHLAKCFLTHELGPCLPRFRTTKLDSSFGCGWSSYNETSYQAFAQPRLRLQQNR